jgi:hypothetical protein
MVYFYIALGLIRKNNVLPELGMSYVSKEMTHNHHFKISQYTIYTYINIEVFNHYKQRNNTNV